MSTLTKQERSKKIGDIVEKVRDRIQKWESFIHY